MNRLEFLSLANSVFADCPGNLLTKENIISPDLVGMQLFDTPLVGFASAEIEGIPSKTYTSNWFERHAAYACGLGTLVYSPLRVWTVSDWRSL